MAALRALGTSDAPTDLSLRLDYRLQHLLLDEFQDTSATQLDLVQQLTAGWQRGDGRSVFCVGDPMQSIYGFRQAEVRAFLDLAEEGLGDGAIRGRASEQQFSLGSARSSIGSTAASSKSCREHDDRERGAIAFRPEHGRSCAGRRGRGSREPARICQRRRRGERRCADGRGVPRAPSRVAYRHPGARAHACARNRARAARPRYRVPRRGYRAVAGSPRGARRRDARMRAFAPGRPGGVARRAAGALVRPHVERSVGGRPSAPAHLGCAERCGGARALERGRASRCARLRGVLEAAFKVQTHTRFARWIERTWLALGGPSCAADARELDQVRRRVRALARARAAGPAGFRGSWREASRISTPMTAPSAAWRS